MQILNELPTEERSVLLATALANLEALSAGQAMRMSPCGVQASLRYIVRLLGNLQMSITLDEKPESCSSLVRNAISQFSYFCEQIVDDGLEEGGKITLRGPKAYEALYFKLKNDLGCNKEVLPADFQRLQTFRWCAGPLHAAASLELIAELAKAEEPAKKKSKASIGGSSSSKNATGSASSKGVVSEKDKGKAAAMLMFHS